MSKIVVEIDGQDVEELFEWTRQVLDNQEAMLIKMDKILEAISNEAR